MAAKKPEKRMAAKKTPAKKASPSKGVATKRARKKALTPEALARKIVKVTQNPNKLSLDELYAEDCTSFEPGMSEPSVGHEGLRAKIEFWQRFQDNDQAKWTAKNVFVKRTTICIEWEAQIVTKDGRSLTLNEVAIHETKGGKITAERYYYDPTALSGTETAASTSAPSPEASRPSPAGSPGRTRPRRPPATILDLGDETGPKVDPIDL